MVGSTKSPCHIKEPCLSLKQFSCDIRKKNSVFTIEICREYYDYAVSASVTFRLPLLLVTPCAMEKEQVDNSRRKNSVLGNEKDHIRVPWSKDICHEHTHGPPEETEHENNKYQKVCLYVYFRDLGLSSSHLQASMSFSAKANVPQHSGESFLIARLS